MKKTVSKKEVEKQIEEFFHHITEKKSIEIRKIKKLAMSYNIKLGNKKKTFCKKCFHPYVEPSVRINNDMVNITCEKCEHISKWKLTEEPIMPINEDGEIGCAC
jgi:RNase P subunit RPR2